MLFGLQPTSNAAMRRGGHLLGAPVHRAPEAAGLGSALQRSASGSTAFAWGWGGTSSTSALWTSATERFDDDAALGYRRGLVRRRGAWCPSTSGPRGGAAR
jgi:hypothetical protein